MTDLAATLRAEQPFYVEKLKPGVEPMTGGGSYDFSVGYNDELAHRYADLVARSASALAASAGVVAAEYSHPEEVLVAAPDLTAADIRAALRRFWKGAATDAGGPPPWKERLDAVVAGMAPVLKEAGFRKRALVWNRTVGDFLQVVQLERMTTIASERHPGVRLCYGVLSLVAEELELGERSTWAGEVDCHLRFVGGRTGDVLALTADDVSDAVLTDVRDEALPTLDAMRSIPEALALARQRGAMVFAEAMLLLAAGDRAGAQRHYQRLFDEVPAKRPAILQSAAAHGLTIVTGGDSVDSPLGSGT